MNLRIFNFYAYEYTMGKNFVDWFTYKLLNTTYYDYYIKVIYPN